MPCGDKKGNNVYCEFSPEGPAIINSMPRVDIQPLQKDILVQRPTPVYSHL